MANPLTHRFRIGGIYRLRTSKVHPKYVGGTMRVISELKPTDQWGNRIILADFNFDPPMERNGSTVTAMKGARAFVEEGYSEFTDSFGTRKIPVEIAALQGIYPLYGKAYALDECTITGAA